MALNSSGPISLGGSTAGESVNLAVGQSATDSISFNSSVTRLISGTVAGSQISMPPDFWGKSFTPPVSNAVYDPSNNWRLTFVYSTANASTGDYYVVGQLVDSLYSGPYYGYVAKYNSSGVQQWQQAYSDGTPAGLLFYATYNLTPAVYDPVSGNIYILGTSNSIPIIISISSSTGAVVWTRQFTPPGGLSLYDPVSLGVDSSGNPICMIQTSGTSGVLIKLNSSGTILWQKTSDISSFKYADTITTDSSDNIYISTRTTTSSIGGIALLKLDSSGNLSFFRKIAASNAVAGDDGSGYSIRMSSSGRLYMGGYIYDQSTFTYSAVLMEMSPSAGSTISSYVCQPRPLYDGTNTVANIYFDSNGYVYCLCPGSSSSYSYIVARFPADLSAPMWSNAYGYTSTGFRVYSMVQIGNSYVAVGKGVPGSGYRDMGLTMQMPIDGSLTGTKTFSTLTAGSVTAYDAVSLNTVTRALSNSSAPITLSNSSVSAGSITVNTITMPASLTVENRSQS